MNKLLLPAIIVFSIIIIVEIAILFFRPSASQNLNSQNEQYMPTASGNLVMEYQPIRNYKGRVISFTPATNGYLFDLTYTNMDNLKGTLYFNEEEAQKAKIQYINNAEEIIEEKTGLDLDTLQPQDRFDIMITDQEKEMSQPSNPQELKVDSILFRIYKD